MGGNAIFSDGEPNARGVCILIRKGLEFSITKTTCDSQGRYIIADLVFEDKKITLNSLYAPNLDDPDFFLEVLEKQAYHSNDDTKLRGDFNFMFDTTVDCTK